MIFMNIETGDIYEFLLLSIEGPFQYKLGEYKTAFRIGDFTLHGTTEPRACSTLEMSTKFEFIGFI